VGVRSSVIGKVRESAGMYVTLYANDGKAEEAKDIYVKDELDEVWEMLGCEPVQNSSFLTRGPGRKGGVVYPPKASIGLCRERAPPQRLVLEGSCSTLPLQGQPEPAFGSFQACFAASAALKNMGQKGSCAGLLILSSLPSFLVKDT